MVWSVEVLVLCGGDREEPTAESERRTEGNGLGLIEEKGCGHGVKVEGKRKPWTLVEVRLISPTSDIGFTWLRIIVVCTLSM